MATATSDDGLALLFNVEPGNVQVDAEVNGTSLRQHTVVVSADAVTSAGIVP